MANNIHLIAFPAKDLAKSKAFFNTFLGTEPYVDGDYYVGYKADNLEIGLDPNGTAVITYVDVDDIQVSLKALQESGGQVVKESTDVGGGLLIAQVDIDGSIVGLRQG